MEHRKFSWLSFAIGAAAGLLVSTLIVIGSITYFYNVARSGTWDEHRGIVRQIGSQIRANIKEEGSLSVYGKVTNVENGMIEITANLSLGEKIFRFHYDEGTVIVYLNNDDESSEVPMSATDLQLGDGVTVIANEPVGSVPDQYAVKIVRI